MSSIDQIETLGNGIITIDIEKCKHCTSKACAKSCPTKLIEIRDGIPAFLVSANEIKRGACLDCLACELDCDLYGHKALKIVYPMPELDRYLRKLKERGIEVIWRRSKWQF